MVGTIDTPTWLYLFLVAVVALERLYELRLSRRNIATAMAQGAVEHGQGHYRWMVLLHSALLVAAPAEAVFLARPMLPALAWPMVACLLLAQALRYWAIHSLGRRWNVRVVVLPGAVALRRGPYRWMRHPNYLAVVIEIAALPLLHSAWLTALVFSTLNAWLLRVRIRCEEAALAAHASYHEVFSSARRARS